MTPNEEQRKIQAIIALAELRGKELSKAAVRLWLAALDDVSADDVCLAVGRACKYGGPHMESPKEIRQHAGEVTPEYAALKAWDLACDAIKRCGGYHTMRFADRRITATIRSMGGWPNFCWSEEEDKWMRHRFLRTYEALCERPIGDDEGQVLEGEHARVNGIMGYPVAKPDEIEVFGDPADVPRLPGDDPRRRQIPLVEFKKP